ncbi:MAG: hypothetical protein CVV16_10810 [Gammaproteobacteria bacterium HGW-Gammaproteobacteria-6]|nr:MAG: hypothetical protein CVV16_10810 [Gammaproteobacteria bacterium HGW-Gammaproteobacteria-6]
MGKYDSRQGANVRVAAATDPSPMPLLDDACASVPTNGGLTISLGSIDTAPQPGWRQNGERRQGARMAQDQAIGTALNILKSCYATGASP